MSAPDGPCGVVLCGGSSTRMGADKATLGPPGDPLAGRVAAALRDAGVAEVLLVGGDRAALEVHGDDWVPDDRPGQGPLAALATAARHRPDRDLLVCACDLPDLTGPALAPLVGALVDGADAAAVRLDGVPQWSVVAVSARTARSLTAPDGAPARGERSLHRALRDRTRLLSVPPELAARYRDVDRPEDLPPDLGHGAGGPDGR